MVNEAHNGWSRCTRTRRVGREILPAAYESGCRYLAMEALPNDGHGPTIRKSLSKIEVGYLAHSDMRELTAAASHLGFSFVAYELGLTAPSSAYRDDPFSIEATNHREQVQAENLVAAYEQIGRVPMLVWCGNSHHAKIGVPQWTPMGARFVDLAGFEPFCIDQISTVAFADGGRPNIQLTEEWCLTLESFGGTAGFTADDPPTGLEVPAHFDALILSTDNEMVRNVGSPQ
jgi:hypothetical protein